MVAHRLFSLTAERMQAALLGEPSNSEAIKEKIMAVSMRDAFTKPDRSDALVLAEVGE